MSFSILGFLFSIHLLWSYQIQICLHVFCQIAQGQATAISGSWWQLFWGCRWHVFPAFDHWRVAPKTNTIEKSFLDKLLIESESWHGISVWLAQWNQEKIKDHFCCVQDLADDVDGKVGWNLINMMLQESPAAEVERSYSFQLHNACYCTCL